MKVSRTRFMAIAGLSLLTAGSAYSQQAQVSVDEVVALFYQRNLDLIAAQYNIDQARAEQVVAGAIPNPVFGVRCSSLRNQ